MSDLHLSDRVDLAILNTDLKLWTNTIQIISWCDVPVVLMYCLTPLPELQKCSRYNTAQTRDANYRCTK